MLVINGTNNPIRLLNIKINQKLKKLNNIFSKISTANTLLPEDLLLQPNETGIIYLLLNSKIPMDIKNEIILQTENDPSTLQSIIVNININESQPIIISPPLKGTNWYAASAIDNFVGHRRSIFILNGQIKIPERTAVDFVQYGPKGLYDGDPLVNTSYYGYGNTIYSPCHGKVIGVMDHIPENIPTKPAITPVNSKTIGGNYVLIKNKKHYAFLAHMIPGSLKVKIGDSVKVGQKLGLLGNSGQSTTPHLHFHITNRPESIGDYKIPSPINAQGIPWVFDHFILNQYHAKGVSIVGPLLPQNVHVVNKKIIKKQILMNNNLVNFL